LDSHIAQVAGSDERDAGSPGLVQLLYPELRALAAALLQGAAGWHTLQPTGLVHELYLRLAGRGTPEFNDQDHFMAVAARAMRQILADHARRAKARKRGGGLVRVSLDDAPAARPCGDLDLGELDSALSRLSLLHDRQARVVELRFFCGLSQVEIARCLGVSVETVKRDWRMARAWLMGELAGQEVHDS
jgi:RNA polymerase sigma factor (TIGR02999 family)